jgi:hypothetical protein
MKRFLTLLAGGLLLAAASAGTSDAQTNFNMLRLGTGANILTLTGPASGGAATYSFPAPSGTAAQVLTTAGGQNIDGALTAGANGDVLSGLLITPSFNDGIYTGVSHAYLTLGKNSAAGNIFISDGSVAAKYGVITTGSLTATRSYTLPNASGTVALTSDVTTAVTGTVNAIPKFATANSLGDSKLTDDGSDLKYNVNKFGVNATSGNITAAGTITGLTGITSSGTITLSGLNTTGIVHNTNAGVLSTGLVDLTTDVTGLLPGANGGTGVNNGTKTITLGGNFTTSGANNLTLTTTGATNVTLPTSGTLATTGNSVQYAGSNGTLATATTKLFDVGYTDVTTTGNLAGASVTSDGSNSTGAANVTSTGLTVGAVAKGTGNATALVVTATGGTGTKKAIDASGAIVTNGLSQAATMTATTGASGFTLGTAANATVLSSTATTSRAINFPDANGTLALTSDLASSVSGTANAISKFTSATAVGNSLLTDDGSDLKYNTNKFAVNATSGNITASGTITGLTGITSTGDISLGGVANTVAINGDLTGAGANKFANVAQVTGNGVLTDFTITNSRVKATSTIIVTARQGSAGSYAIPMISTIGAGSFGVHLSGPPANTETMDLHYIVIN